MLGYLHRYLYILGYAYIYPKKMQNHKQNTDQVRNNEETKTHWPRRLTFHTTMYKAT